MRRAYAETFMLIHAEFSESNLELTVTIPGSKRYRKVYQAKSCLLYTSSEPMDEPGSSPPDSAAESAGVMVPAIDGPDLPPGTGTGLEDGCETHGDSPDLPQEVPGASAPADSSSGEAPTGEAPLPPPVSEGDASPSVFPAESLDELLAETEAGTEAAGGDSFTEMCIRERYR